MAVRRLVRPLAVVLPFVVLAPAGAPVRASAPEPAAPAARAPRLPFDFVENRGQWDATVRFAVRTGHAVVGLARDHIVLQPSAGEPVTLTFAGSSPDVALEGGAPRPGLYNYNLGADAARWVAGAPAYGHVTYRRLYEGIDLRVRDAGGVLEYDLLLAPRAGLHQARVRVDGARSLEIAADGALLLHTDRGILRQSPPVTWEQLPDGGTRPVASRFVLLDDRHYGFEAPGRDVTRPLVIDPGLEWGTFLGGSGHDTIYDVALARDGSGDVVVIGFTTSPDFPATSGGLGPLNQAPFLARLDSTGSVLKFSTLYGGSGVDSALGLAFGPSGDIAVAGNTSSADFPVTAGAYDTTYNGDYDGYAARFDGNTGALLFASYLGGSRGGSTNPTLGYEEAWAVGFDTAGSLIVAGNTTSADFPVTQGAYDTTANRYTDAENDSLQDIFVSRFNAAGSALTYSTFLGGHGVDYAAELAVDSQGLVTVAGRTQPVTRPDTNGNQIPLGTPFPTTANAFDRTLNGNTDIVLARLRPAGGGAADLIYSTLLGGNDTEHATGLSLHPSNDAQATIAGWSYSGNYPTTAAVVFPAHFAPINTTMGIVTRVDLATGGVVWSTYYGAPGNQQADDLVVDATGAPIVVGATGTRNPPTTERAYDRTPAQSDAFVARLNASATQVLYASLLGGSSFEGRVRVAYAGGSNVVIGGQTKSTDFPTTPGAFDRVYGADGTPSAFTVYDVFLAKMQLEPADTGDTTADAPDPVAPAQGATFSAPATVALDWSDVSDPSGVEAYHVQVSPNATFTDTLQAQLAGWYEAWPSASEAGTDFRAGTYFWRVRMLDGSHNLSDWSAVRSFTVGTPPTPAAPALISPASGATVSLPVRFDWSDVSGAASYTIQVDDSSSFPSPHVASASVAVSDATFSALPATTLWWRVRGVNSVGTAGAWSTVRSVRVAAAPAPASLSSLTVNPTAVNGGTSAQGTVALTAAAPSGGMTVGLSSSHPAATVPSSVTVPAGATNAVFTIATTAVTTTATATITGAAGTVTRSATLTVRPASGADTVAIQRAEYNRNRRELRVEATSTSSSATLTVSVTSTGAVIGTLSHQGGGRYTRTFRVSSNPQTITVRSSLGGEATRGVTQR